MKPEPLRYEAGVISVHSDIRLLHNQTRSCNAVLNTLTSRARKAIEQSAPVTEHATYLW